MRQKECAQTETKNEKLVLKRSTKRLIFYILMIALPLSLWFLFGLFVNFNSFILAFQKYSQPDLNQIGYTIEFAWFENFGDALSTIFDNLTMVKNSLYLFAFNLVIVIGFALVFSYYIAKKFPLAGFFRVILFIPQIISSVVLVLLFKYMVNTVLPQLLEKIAGADYVKDKGLAYGFLAESAPQNVQFFTVLFYNVWVAFGVNVMIFTGSMSSVDTSVIESANLDGVNIIQEFIHIYIPMIWPTFVTFIITQMAALFTNSMHLLTFFPNTKPPFSVFGYFLYVETKKGEVFPKGAGMSYSELAAIGLFLTAILVPLTLGLKKVLLKFGPSVD